MQEIIKNNIYEVLTDDGFKNFDGFLISNKLTYTVTFTDLTNINVTGNHLLYCIDTYEFTDILSLKKNDNIQSENGEYKTIRDIKLFGIEEVVDLINVEDTHSYYTNNVLSHNCLFADEFAFVADNKSREFYAAMLPVLATGGSCIIASTPNNDTDQFSEIWFGAINKFDEFGNETEIGSNGFYPLKFIWSDMSDRNAEWEKEWRSKLGPQKFLQEMEAEFVSEDETLINYMKLATIRGIDPIWNQGQVRWYNEPQPNKTYLIGLDPSLGTGHDPAAIQVFQLPEMIQVCEWSHNKTDPKGQVKTLLDVLTFLDGYLRDCYDQYGDPEIYWTVENNAIGDSILQIIHYTGEEKFPGHFIHERNYRSNSKIRKGLNTTPKKKLTACSKLKSLIETERMKLYSKPLISELKTFVSKETSFSAKPGLHDDLVSATLIICRLVEIITAWGNEDAEGLKDIVDPENDYSEPMPIILS